jgi:hemerythrin-like domain-containing protein
MLAAESAWRILHAEHERMRALLSDIDGVLTSVDWNAAGSMLDALRAHVRSLQEFNDATHRPKGVMLLSLLRGRSAEIDELLARLDADSQCCDQLLSEALGLLDAVERGDEAAGARCATVLRQHRDQLLAHLHVEDTTLRSRAERLLTPQEWSSIVSAISSVVHARGARASPKSSGNPT